MVTATIKTGDKNADLKLRAYVAEIVREVLDDPDFGLELRSDFKRELAKRQASRSKRVPLAEVLKKYGR